MSQEKRAKEILKELSELNIDFSSLEVGTIKDLDKLKNKCPCCGLSMFFDTKTENWKHFIKKE